jgi:hypothetical protein
MVPYYASNVSTNDLFDGRQAHLEMRYRPTLIEVLVVIGIAGILLAVVMPGHGHRPRPVTEQEMFGYWVAIPSAHSAFRLFLTNDGAGLLGTRDIYTNLWRVTSWQVTNRDISIELAPITAPEWPNEYIRGKVLYGEIRGARGGVNQNGERWKRDITFYREDIVRQDLAAAAAIMRDHTEIIEPDGAANGSQPIRSETNRTSSTAGSHR